MATVKPGEGSSPSSAAASKSDPGPQSGSEIVPLNRSPGFWTIIGYAVLAGLVLTFVALAFLGLLSGGTKLWFTLPKNPGWGDGPIWWVAVTAGAGLLVGVLRHLFRLPVKIPGTLQDIKDERVELSLVPKAVLVSLISLAGGASLGPEEALGMLGGGFGTYVSRRRKVEPETREINTLSGMSAAYGGMLASPIMASALVLEVARLQGRRFGITLVAILLSSSIAFAIYYPIAGSTFVGTFRLPPFKFEDWQMAAAIPLGLVAGLLALITVVVIGLVTKLTAPLVKWTVLRPLIGGVAFGLVAVALPLTLFTGTDQLQVVIRNEAVLGAGLLIAVVFAKILVFALCESTGFIGGPFLVMLFIGGTAGTAAHVLIPGLPEGLAFTTMFAALPGALVAAPFSLLLLAALTTQIGTLQMAPVAIAVLTAYLAVSGSGTLMALVNKAKQPASADGQPGGNPSPSPAAKATR
jgi:H+/Cl- antiporter ClcA